jgi:hypothetical protein
LLFVSFFFSDPKKRQGTALMGLIDSNNGSAGIMAALQDHKTNAAVKEQRKQLRTEWRASDWEGS